MLKNSGTMKWLGIEWEVEKMTRGRRRGSLIKGSKQRSGRRELWRGWRGKIGVKKQKGKT